MSNAVVKAEAGIDTNIIVEIVTKEKAEDDNFSKVMESVLGSAEKLKAAMTSGLGFKTIASLGTTAMSAINSGITGIIGDMQTASSAWKVFETNMQMNGAAASEIQSIKQELQDFALQTVYTASDMTSTYAQLASAGLKDTGRLAKGLGGLAAATESPQQAIMSLSEQAAKMAAKPKVELEDFKLLLDKIPGGASAVAAAMGMSADEMVKSIEGSQIVTEDFFHAVAEAGTNVDFTNLASQFNTVDQAMDGLKETVGTKLQPAYEELSSFGIKAVSKLTDSFSQIDGEALGAAVGSLVDTVSKYFDIFIENMSGVPGAFGDAFKAIGSELGKVLGKFGSDKSIEGFGDAVSVAGDCLKTFAGFLEDNADKVVAVLKNLPVLLAVVKGFKIFRAMAPAVETLTGAFKGLEKSNLGKLTRMFLGLSSSEKENEDGSKKANEGITSLKTGLNSLQKSAGIALIIGALAGLALALQPLAELGVTAVVPLLTFGAVVASLGVVLGNMGKNLQASMLGIMAFAAAVSLMALAMVPIAMTGTEGAVAMGMFGIVVAALAMVFAAFGSYLTGAIPGMLAFGATVLMVGAGMAMASVMIEALTPFLSQLGNTVTQIAFAIAVAVTMIIASFASLVPVIVGAVTQIVTVIGTVLVNAIQIAGEVISEVIDSISEGFKTITEGISGVIDSISGGLTGILEAIADVISAIGESALNAGMGFELVAIGIERIAGLSIGDVVKALGSVALGLGEIAGKGEGLLNAAAGMSGINAAIMSAATSAAMLNGLLMQLSVLSLSVAMSISMITLAFSGLVIPPLDIGPILAAFAAITMAATMLGSQITALGAQAGTNFTTMFSTGIMRAVIIAANISTSIVNALRTAEIGAFSCGLYIGIGLANGMRTALGEVQAVANQLAAAAEKAVIAKARIGSPSRVFKELGGFIGEGFAIGIASMGDLVRGVSEELVSIPDVPAFEGVSVGNHFFGNQELQNDYTYHPTVYVNAEVRSIMDGREVGYGSARYVREKNDKEEKVRRYISGVR